MKQITNQTFTSYYSAGDDTTVGNVLFADCMFSNCTFSATKDVGRIPQVSNVTLKRCVVESSDVGPCRLRDVTVEDLKTVDLLILWSPMFERVTLRGRIGKIKINAVPHFSDHSDSLLLSFAEARREHYGAVEWALDITEAEVDELSVRGVPSSLIRRDERTQVVIPRSKYEPKRAQVPDGYWKDFLEISFEAGEEAAVLVAPKAKPRRKYDTLLRDLEHLRGLGITE